MAELNRKVSASELLFDTAEIYERETRFRIINYVPIKG